MLVAGSAVFVECKTSTTQQELWPRIARAAVPVA